MKARQKQGIVSCDVDTFPIHCFHQYFKKLSWIVNNLKMQMLSNFTFLTFLRALGSEPCEP